MSARRKACERKRQKELRKNASAPARRRARRDRKRKYQTIFINGKQKRVPRELLIDGMAIDEFILANADPIWLHQNEMWEFLQDPVTPDDSGL